MRRRIQQYLQSETLKNAAYLLTGTVAAQAIGILLVPFLTRIYAPSDFGVFTSFNAFLILAAHFSNGKYGQAIVLPENDGEAGLLYSLSKYINLLVAAVLLTGLVILFSIHWLGDDKYWLLFTPLALFFAGRVEINSFMLTRIRKFDTISVSKVVQSVVNMLSSILIGWAGLFTRFGLIIGMVISQIITSTYGFFFLPRYKTGDIKSHIRGLKEIALKYKKYSLYGIPGALIDSFAQQLPVYYLLYLGSEATIGHYGLAVRIVQIPGILIAGSLNNVLFQKMSVMNMEGKSLAPLVRKTSLFIAQLFIPVALILLLVAPQLFAIVFGPAWAVSGEYVRVLFIIFTIRIIVSPISIIFSVKNKLNISFLWQLSYFVLGLLFFIAMYYLKIEFHFVLIYFAVFELVLYSVYFYLIWNIAPSYDQATAE